MAHVFNRRDSRDAFNHSSRVSLISFNRRMNSVCGVPKLLDVRNNSIATDYALNFQVVYLGLTVGRHGSTNNIY